MHDCLCRSKQALVYIAKALSLFFAYQNGRSTSAYF
jgi:hypothetical protein